MAAHLEVVNEALIKLGASPIASMSDAGAQATAARALFRTTYTRLLAETPWYWALNKVELPKLASVDYHAFDRFEYVYQLPSDLIRSVGLDCYCAFRVMGDRLYTNADPAALLYVADTQAEKWPGYFRELVVDSLASRMAISVTDSTNRAVYWSDQANNSRARAMAIDAQQTPPEILNLMRIYMRRHPNPLATA